MILASTLSGHKYENIIKNAYDSIFVNGPDTESKLIGFAYFTTENKALEYVRYEQDSNWYKRLCEYTLERQKYNKFFYTISCISELYIVLLTYTESDLLNNTNIITDSYTSRYINKSKVKSIFKI